MGTKRLAKSEFDGGAGAGASNEQSGRVWMPFSGFTGNPKGAILSIRMKVAAPTAAKVASLQPEMQ